MPGKSLRTQTCQASEQEPEGWLSSVFDSAVNTVRSLVGQDTVGNACMQEMLEGSQGVAFFDSSAQYPLAQPIAFFDRDGNCRTVDSLSGDDLNVAARVLFAEVSGSWQNRSLSDADREEERQAMASVLWNRMGAMGVSGGPQDSLTGVTSAPNQFTSMGGDKYDSASQGRAPQLNEWDKADLAAAFDTIRQLLCREDGPWFDYTSNRGGTRGRGEVHGGSRFWTDDAITRKESIRLPDS